MSLAVTADGNAKENAPDLAVDLARFAASIDPARLEPEVVKAVKTNILDTLSCALAGSSAKGIPEVTELVRECAGASQAVGLIGVDVASSVPSRPMRERAASPRRGPCHQ